MVSLGVLVAFGVHAALGVPGLPQDVAASIPDDVSAVPVDEVGWGGSCAGPGAGCTTRRC